MGEGPGWVVSPRVVGVGVDRVERTRWFWSEGILSEERDKEFFGPEVGRRGGGSFWVKRVDGPETQGTRGEVPQRRNL